MHFSSTNKKNKLYFNHLFPQFVEENYCLNGLSQAHFISQYRICTLRPGKPHPVQSFQLIWMQFATINTHILRLLFQLLAKLRFLRSIESL